jgi:hypothetical protein
MHCILGLEHQPLDSPNQTWANNGSRHIGRLCNMLWAIEQPYRTARNHNHNQRKPKSQQQYNPLPYRSRTAWCW